MKILEKSKCADLEQPHFEMTKEPWTIPDVVSLEDVDIGSGPGTVHQDGATGTHHS